MHRVLLRPLALALALGWSSASTAGGATRIEVLSNRADLISGGDALVEVVPAPPPGTVIDLDGSDVTGAFAPDAEGRYLGLVSGLAVGPNLLSASLPDGSGAAITIENHPSEGPIFGGPHLPFWDCTTEANGLGPPLDEGCNAAPVVDYLYVSSSAPQLGYQAYDPQDPPSDVALVTTNEGQTVRHIVRRERGAMNRGLYAYAHLHDPALGEPDPLDPQPGWNRVVVFTFGGGGGAKYHQGPMPGVTNRAVLSLGYAIAMNSLNVFGHHGNTVTSGESVMMLKERIIEQIGEVRYTIGTGSSGGAVQQNQIANAYPGLLTGIIPSLAYSDSFSAALEVADCVTLEAYWPIAAVPFTPAQRWAVDGHAPPATSCPAFFGPALPGSTPFDGCFELPDTRDYNPVTNPDGCRSKNPDIWINILGRRPHDGFGKFMFDNVGVQYGLDALNLPLGDPGKITFAQFLDLNSRAGGQDIEGLLTTRRNWMDPDVDWIAYRTSHMVDGRGLARAPVINLGAIDNFEFHNPFHAHASEARMRAIGHGDNHVLWHAGITQLDSLALATMKAWLDGVEAAGGIDPYSGIDPALLGAHRPAIAEDACWITGSAQPLETCESEVWGDARLVAGMPRSHDNYHCQLRAVDPADYAGAFPALTPADIAQIEAIFPEGVCDYSKPSRGAAPSLPWLSFEGGPGGQPLGPPPTSTPF